MAKFRQGKTTARPEPGHVWARLLLRWRFWGFATCSVLLQTRGTHRNRTGEAPVARRACDKWALRHRLFPGAVSPEGSKMGRGGRAWRGDRCMEGGLREVPREPSSQRSGEWESQATAATGTKLTNDQRQDMWVGKRRCHITGCGLSRQEVGLDVNGNRDKHFANLFTMKDEIRDSLAVYL